MNSAADCYISLLLTFLLLQCSNSSDNITPNKPITDGVVLVSSGKIFALGFFSPGNSSKRFVGVWYNNVPNQTVVWVANRNRPLNDTSGLLAVHGNGGLVIYGKDRGTPIWSANVTLNPPGNFLAKILDTGNLVLHDNTSQSVSWQSFDYPTNTMLPGMKLMVDRRSGLNRFLTSWKSKDDPGTGNCSYRVDPDGLPQMFLYKDGAPRWRSEITSWNSKTWKDVMRYFNNQDEVSLMSVVNTNSSIPPRTVLHESGVVEWYAWNDLLQQWTKYWSAPSDRCDSYGQCGLNGKCDPYRVEDRVVTLGCSCLPGFGPKSPTHWKMRNGSDGCIRETREANMCRNGEGFVKVENVKIPNSSRARVNMNVSLKGCEQECLRNCSCTAYSGADESSEENGCVTWYGDLMDTSTILDGGQDLYVRVNASVLGKDNIDDNHTEAASLQFYFVFSIFPILIAQYGKKSRDSLSKKQKLAVSTLSVVTFILLVCLLYWLVRRQREGKQSFLMTFKQRGRVFFFFFFFFWRGRVQEHIYSVVLYPGSTYFAESDNTNSDLPFFNLTIIGAATNNFSVENMIGTGGFGSVYKGTLSNGTEIAVKRLSENSGQGIQEFKNEVMLIAKLQHRNLVRIFGCCVQDKEKMLIYEHLPNRSLDLFIFNETNRALLDWTKRCEIIHGIARGLLYMHQDSRLRIIHRDLKASNVLLDASMNPKIADFGLAKIFRGDQSECEANTNRVVGTYGYMSPEYAMEGIFSLKSDVYSFGVLVLEIITGQKNTRQFHTQYQNTNLVKYVWNLWKEGNVLEVVDPFLGVSYPVNEVLRCIQIAFLCVQEYATDRPNMSAVLLMLSNDADLPSPKRRTAYSLLEISDDSGEWSSRVRADPVNELI
uniref:G-type lectin S-receptor-like serine/threonine-protein kinase At1g11410 n=1 Tax=Fragaria vesca subsp. vesca TaxID=101020 RepID=UPI0005C9B0B1|nr:PREDICTED: G-type lectin S-receptor-like serine/threonine-protein kinase At1g11410 [Fragaria vesca subsp. vesca]